MSIRNLEFYINQFSEKVLAYLENIKRMASIEGTVKIFNKK